MKDTLTPRAGPKVVVRHQTRTSRWVLARNATASVTQVSSSWFGERGAIIARGHTTHVLATPAETGASQASRARCARFVTSI